MLDEKDAALVALLRKDGRAPWAQLGAAVGLSSDAVRVRVERLTSEGKARLTTLVDPSVFGFRSRVSVAITLLGDPEPFLEWARAQDEITHLVRVCGRFSFFAEIVTPSLEAAHDVVYRGIGSVTGVVAVEAIPLLRVLRWRDDTRPNWISSELPMTIEPSDIEIMRYLVDEPRMEFTELADRLGRPYGTLRRRAMALYTSGVVRTTAVVDDAAARDVQSAILLIPRVGKIDALPDRLLIHEEITILSATSGRFAFVGELVARSNEHMEEVLTSLTTAARSPVEAIQYARVEKLPGSLSFRHAPDEHRA